MSSLHTASRTGKARTVNYNPSTREKLGILLNNYETFGFWQTLGHALAYVLSRPRDEFDRKYGVSTAGTLLPSNNEITDELTFDNALGYEPTHEAVVRQVLRHVRAHFEPQNLTFVDLGCGRGRALLMAAELPFREVIGVEISPSHCEVAERNAAQFVNSSAQPAGAHRRAAVRSSIRVRCADATRFDFPNTDLFVYMFNPFRGPVFRAMLDQLAAFQRSTRRQVHVALSYPQPHTEQCLRLHPAFVKQHECQVIAPAYSWNLWQCRSAIDRSAQPGIQHANGAAADSGARDILSYC
jgi:SAM-dependent methyltransferase